LCGGRAARAEESGKTGCIAQALARRQSASLQYKPRAFIASAREIWRDKQISPTHARLPIAFYVHEHTKRCRYRALQLAWPTTRICMFEEQVLECETPN
jgi:hypothetical protein